MSSTPTPITERTKVSGNLKGLLAMALAVFGGGVTAGGYIRGLTFQVAAMESRMGDLVTKGDLRDLKRELAEGVQRRLDSVLVKCPRTAARGEAWVECRVVLPKEEP